jgi:ribosomal protein L37E
MACDRCGNEPDADLTRYVAYEGDDEVLGFALCPACGYGFNTLLRAYVANRELSLR